MPPIATTKPKEGTCTVRRLPDGSYQQDWLDPDCKNAVCTDPKEPGGPSGPPPSNPPPDTPPWSPPPPPDHCPTGPYRGNPIHIGSGNKYQRENDLAGYPGYTRHYNSGIAHTGLAHGTHWRSGYESSLNVVGDLAEARRPDGKIYSFTRGANGWSTDADLTDRLETITGGWRYLRGGDGVVETYDGNGRLARLDYPFGRALTLTYDSTGRLVQVSEETGRALALTHTLGVGLELVTDPAGGVHQYQYDGTGRLTAITYPDGASRQYHYEDSRHPHALTGITDETGQRYATYAYDDLGRAIRSEHAGGVERVDIAYNSGASTVTDALGTPRDVGLTRILGVSKNTGESQPGGSGCGPAASAVAYDAQGNVSSRADFNGQRTCHAYDLARNLETLRLEGLGEAACPADLGAHTPSGPQRKVHSQWHPDWRLQTRRAEPKKRTTWVYNGQPDPDAGNALVTCAPADALVIDKPIAVLCKKTEQATDDATGQHGFAATPVGAARVWRYTYDRYGHVLSEDGPRTDVGDVVSHEYWPIDAACPGAGDGPGRDKGCRGKLKRSVNGLGHASEVRRYNAHGQPEILADANGLITTLSYDARLRLTRREVGGEVTQYRYDPAGQLIETTAPDGSRIAYTYDAARRLIGLADNLGNRIDYSLDLMGNRLREDVRDPAGQLRQTRSREYDALNRLWREIGARPDDTTYYAYDAAGNLTETTDPLGRVTQHVYDPLNRLVRTLQPSPGNGQPTPEIGYAYDGLDQLVEVTDPRGLATRYSLDGLGATTRLDSPDTGSTQQSHDAAGNLVSRTDAKGQTTTYTYDALNRVIQVRFHDGSRQAYTYDQGSNGLGRLGRVAEYDAAGGLVVQTDTTYDAHGRITGISRQFAGQTVQTGYTYDSAGRLSRLTYPSGRTLGYTYDAAGRVSALATQAAGEGSPRAVVSAVTYHPFGGIAGYTQGNGQARPREHNLDGRLASYVLGGVRHDINYDNAGQIVSITPASGSPNLYAYDGLGRLSAATLPGSHYAGYTYDAVGNRLSRTLDSATTVNTYASGSNRLATVAGVNQGFDANGSLISNGSIAFQYDARGRMIRAGATDYALDAQGQRIRKRGAGNDIVYHYDLSGHLIAEHGPGGTVKQEYLWLGDLPVAVIAK